MKRPERLREVKYISPKHTAFSNVQPYPLGYTTASAMARRGHVFSARTHGISLNKECGHLGAEWAADRHPHVIQAFQEETTTPQARQGVFRNAAAPRWEPPKEALSTLAIFFPASQGIKIAEREPLPES